MNEYDIVFTPDFELPVEEETKVVKDTPDYFVKVACGKLNVRKGPSKKFGIVKVLTRDTRVKIITEVNGWGKIDENQYIDLTYVNKV